jgi:YVTN family beta-propeller protein
MVTIRKSKARRPRAVRAIGVGGWQTPVAVSPDGKRVYVANRDTDTVSVIDTATEKVVALFRAGVAQSELLVNPGITRC